jgi:hypothetical protein
MTEGAELPGGGVTVLEPGNREDVPGLDVSNFFGAR